MLKNYVYICGLYIPPQNYSYFSTDIFDELEYDIAIYSAKGHILLLGRIVEIFKGNYGHLRSPKVSTRSTMSVRPITKSCFLECYYMPTQDKRTVSKEVSPWYLTLFSGTRPYCPSQRKAGRMNFQQTVNWGQDVVAWTMILLYLCFVRLAVSVISGSLLSDKRSAYVFLAMWFDFTVSML